jgi:RNA polymerase sigma-70 factor (ECF subfamily)
MSASADPISRTLIARARMGDTAALEALYLEHGPAMLGVARRLSGSMADAEDVLHDVFLGLPEALQRYHETGRLGSWLRQVTARAALMRLRRVARRRETAMEHAAELAGTQPGPLTGTTLDAAISRLPADLRVVFVLKEVEGYAHADIADLVGISVGASKVRLFRAIRRLRLLLKDQT